MVWVLRILSSGLILFGSFMVLIKPNRKRGIRLPTEMFAHRGLHGAGVPENSLLAFLLAKERGYGIELDVQLTRDKKVVVFHDPDLLRMCGVDKRVDELTYAELKQYCLGSSHEYIPLLSEVLELLVDVPVICELKPHAGNNNTEICEYVCQEIADYAGELWIESFSPFIVRWFKLNRPDIIRGQLSMDFIRQREGLNLLEAFLMKHLLVNFIGRPDFIGYRAEHSSFGFTLCRRLFQPICLAWTVTEPELKEKMRNRFHGFIFEEKAQGSEESH